MLLSSYCRAPRHSPEGVEPNRQPRKGIPHLVADRVVGDADGVEDIMLPQAQTWQELPKISRFHGVLL